MRPTTKTYVRYLMPGALVPEEGVREVPERNPYQVARDLPDDVFAFEFFDKLITTAEDGGETVTLASGERNRSGRFYIDAEKLTTSDIASAAAAEVLPGDRRRVLLSNMRSNGWDVMLRCRTGNFQPMQAGDSIITLRETAR
jgi:hypothetical protein